MTQDLVSIAVLEICDSGKPPRILYSDGLEEVPEFESRLRGGCVVGEVFTHPEKGRLVYMPEAVYERVKKYLGRKKG